MNFKNLVSLSLVIFSSIVSAEVEYIENGRLHTWENSEAETYLLDKSLTWNGASAVILHNNGGTKIVGLSIYPNKEITECDDSSSKGDGIIYIDGQAVKVYVFCSQYSDSGNYYYSFGAKTQAGRSFIFNRFKSSPDIVTIRYLNAEDIPISAKGFTAEWNKVGAGAL